jgi:hypothetical protein
MAISLSGSLEITGSINATGGITGSFSGTATTASYALVATSASYANNATSASYALNATTSSFALNATTSSFALVATSASYAANSDLLDGRDSLTFANTGSNSFVGTQNINGAVAITGSLTTTGAITAQTLNVQQVTSSIVYSSGSNIFGNSISNTQSMTGSVGISGSLAVTGASTITGALTLNSTITNGTYTYTLPSATGTLALTSALSSYLLLTGGTLTGALSGTSATFSGLVSLGGATATNPLNIRTANGESYIRFLNADGTTYGDFERSITGSGAIRFTGAFFRITGTLETQAINASAALSGTSATFSSSVTANELILLNSGGTYANWYVSTYLIGRIGNVDSNDMYYDSTFGGNHYFRTGTGGTTSPTTKLTIASTGAATFSGNLSCSGAAIQLNQTELIASTGGSNRAYALAIGNVAAGDFVIMQGSTATGGTYTPRLTINPTGNVGIGTTTPLQLLHLKAAGDIFLRMDAGTKNINVLKAYSSTGDVSIGTEAANDRLYIKDNGSVGIGTTSPLDTTTNRTVLTVNGAANGAFVNFGISGTLTSFIQTVAAGMQIGTQTDIPIEFRTNATTRLTIAASTGAATFSSSVTTGGNITITKTTAGLILDGNSGGGNSGAFINLQGWANTNKNWQLGVANIGGSGLLLQTSTAAGGNSFTTSIGGFDETTGAYTALSDINRKKDFEKSEIGLDAILSLKPTLYRIKEEDETTDKHLGFIAQEVKEFIPQAYSKSGDFIGLDYNPIVAALVKSIQELNAKITELENK